jgi:hypothetical protein
LVEQEYNLRADVFGFFIIRKKAHMRLLQVSKIYTFTVFITVKIYTLWEWFKIKQQQKIVFPKIIHLNYKTVYKQSNENTKCIHYNMYR